MDQQELRVSAGVGSRWFYAAPASKFLRTSTDGILAVLVRGSPFSVESTQRDAWIETIQILKQALPHVPEASWLALEFSIPRVGKRADAVMVAGHAIVVIEFKVGDGSFGADGRRQVWDYALDLKNFHSESHDATLVPVLVATQASSPTTEPVVQDDDGVVRPIDAVPRTLADTIRTTLRELPGRAVEWERWAAGQYSPTPTIVEAATALYRGHAVEAISRGDAGATNLTATTGAIDRIVRESRQNRQKSICFVTGVPGAGKTLVGLNVASTHMERGRDSHCVFLSGNGPLVAVLREALAQDRVANRNASGATLRIGDARRQVGAMIQNVHHFRDEYVRSPEAPFDHVALFDEAQRAWNREQTAKFMKQKRNLGYWKLSEPEFLISCMDRHTDWATIICLVGGGQEINTGEAGIGEWLRAVRGSFPHWRVHISPHLHDAEFAAGEALAELHDSPQVSWEPALHLSVSMRSFRAERLSEFVKRLLDRDVGPARSVLAGLKSRYPIVLCRSVDAAKAWLRSRARGNERIGLMVSSQASRLKPLAIDVRAPLDPVDWFLKPGTDVRSSLYLEDAATEFDVQGLELDWVGVVWDADFRSTSHGWEPWAFRGAVWKRIRAQDRVAYLKNAYRVLLTRARQGMVIVVPEGDEGDPTRDPTFYDPTYEYLLDLGVDQLD
ncbi:MAG: DUF2075 domain-containing protein [Phycisphaeraceae bacterium]|nr:DUF2075 domain-containing protein [Phycisphaeraceae bacterium]